MARPAGAGAGKGAGSSSWAFSRESRESSSNQPTLLMLRVGGPILDRKTDKPEGPSGVLKSQGQGQGCLEYLSLPSNDSLSLALGNCRVLGPPVGPELVLQPTPPGHNGSLRHTPPRATEVCGQASPRLLSDGWASRPPKLPDGSGPLCHLEALIARSGDLQPYLRSSSLREAAH